MTKVLWTTNKHLISDVTLQTNSSDIRNSVILVAARPGEKGNAVALLHNGNLNDPALWSWHIWATSDDPTENTTTYLTETPIPTSYNFINRTASKLPPIIIVLWIEI